MASSTTTTETTPFFTLQAQPGTDIWRKPPSTDIWTVPITRTQTNPLHSFRSARITFWADWKEQYDQAGLLLVPRPASSPYPSSTSSTNKSPPPQHWIKTGVEFYESQPRLSTVSCERFADWSLGEAVIDVDVDVIEGKKGGKRGGVTIEVRREGDDDEHGVSLWVYRVLLDEEGEVRERIPLREICWVFSVRGGKGEGKGEEEKKEDWVLDVSPLVARPEKKKKKDSAGLLEVEFWDFRVEWA
ncbi:hypothetical protein F4778DRAFT_92570 [Xylariomycetidae sp. FL2044]|nr:hypothetical protein F4778DRAFT_92570 [Xylariomycetidae sp. FL2044]